MAYFESSGPATRPAPHCSSPCPQGARLHASERSVGMISRLSAPLRRRSYASPDRLLFLALLALGLYRAQGLPRRRRDLRSEGQPQAGGAGRTVLRDRRLAADQASSGTAALSDDGIAALARQAR